MHRLPYLIAGAVGLVIIMALLLTFGVGKKPSTPTPVTLEFWGAGDDAAVWRNTINAFRKANPSVTINYTRFNEDAYEETLLNRLAEGKGPDVFLLKSEWLLKDRDKILALPAASSPLSPAQFKAIFVDGTSALIGEDGTLFGTPIFMDSLALFYNKDMFDAAGITHPPTAWDEFTNASRRLTKTAPNGDVVRSGAAMGSGANVPHLLELVSSLILQRGDAIARPDGHMELAQGAERAIDFYASFVNQGDQNFSWTNRMPDALDAFAGGDAAMAFGMSGDIAKIRAKNPHLDFGVAPFPQLASGAARVYGHYAFATVSRLAQSPAAAWQFALFLSSREGAGIYLADTMRPPARRDLIAATPPGSGIKDVFARQALIARDWPIPDERVTRRIFKEATDGIATRVFTRTEALNRLRTQLQLLFP